MKKVLLLFSAVLFAVGTAFAAAVQIDPAKQYTLSFDVEATQGGSVYCKIFSGNDNVFISLTDPASADPGQDYRPEAIGFEANTPKTVGEWTNTPEGDLTSVDRLLILFPWTWVPEGGTSVINITNIKLVDQDGMDLFADATLSAPDPAWTNPAPASAEIVYGEDGKSLTITLHESQQWAWGNQFLFSVQVPGEDPEPEPVKGPDQLFLRGDSFGGWNDPVTDPAQMNASYLATTTDNLLYVWDWSDEPITLKKGVFKIGRLITEEEATEGVAWSNIVNGAYGGVAWKDHIADYGTFEVSTPGSNFNVDNDLQVSRIELDLSAMTLAVSYDEPTAVEETEALAVSASNGRIYADGEFQIFNMAGQDVTADNGNLYGLYIVVAGDEAVKVIVK